MRAQRGERGDLNYRRFFTISTLAGIRVEDPEVFDDSHVEIRRWFDEGLVDGLRVDHPDGLRDPEGYLRDLSELTGGAYVLVEKILEPGEELDPDWSCEGTTGYDALGFIDRVLTDPAGEAAALARSTGRRGRLPRAVHDRKRAVADGVLLAETRRIVRDLVSTGSTSGGIDRSTAPSPSCSPASRSTAPTCRTAWSTSTTPSPWPADRRPDLASTYDVLAPVLHDPDPPGGPALPADERDGDGQGRRGLRVLPLRRG